MTLDAHGDVRIWGISAQLLMEVDMTTEQRIAAIESRYVQGLIDLILDLRSEA